MINMNKQCAVSITRKIIPLLLVLLALFLRSFGLSHDLHMSNIYHPDTPKQMRAAERFIDGGYYFVVGHRDYDGYPYFNSHIVEYVCRGCGLLKNAVESHMGLPVSRFAPDILTLYWITRVLNVVLSTLTVLIIYMIGMTFFGPKVAVLASFFLAISPVDISACHFETADSTTSLLATVAVFFALRIFRRNRIGDYAFGALFAAAAFSAKYHGGMAFVPLLYAHLAHYPLLKGFISKKAVVRLVFLMLAFAAGILLTSPALMICPRSDFRDIMNFIDKTSHFRMTPEIMAMSWAERCMLAMKINLPVLYDTLGLIICLAVAAALFLERKKHEVWILFVMPVVYIVVGLSIKPVSCHAVYHTLVTPVLFLLASIALTRLLDVKKLKWTAGLLFFILTLFSGWYLLDYTRHELFFFRYNDTRRVVESWAMDNVPANIKLCTGRYTFSDSVRQEEKDEIKGEAYVFARETFVPPENSFLMNELKLEESKLTIFRNMNILFYMETTALIRPDFIRPVFQPLPSPRNDNMIFSDAPWFYRSPKVFDIEKGRRIDAIMVSTNAIDSALLVFKCGFGPSLVNVDFGGRRYSVRMSHDETRVIAQDAPRALFLSRNPNHFYHIKIHIPFGKARVILATSDREIGWALYNAGDYHAAYERLKVIPDSIRTLSDQAAIMISGLVSGRMSCDEVRAGMTSISSKWTTPVTRDRFFDYFGISTDYLNNLPGVELTWTDLQWEGFQRVTDDPSGHEDILSVCSSTTVDKNPFIQTPLLTLEPGCYSLVLRVKGQKPECILQVADPLGGVIDMKEPVAASGMLGRDSEEIILPFEISRYRPNVQLRLTFNPLQSFILKDRVSVIPDALRTVNAQLSILDIISGGNINNETLTILDYEPLVWRGDACREEERYEQAFACYSAAIHAWPYRRTAYEKVDAIRQYLPPEKPAVLDHMLAPYYTYQRLYQFHQARATFSNGIRLLGFQQGNDNVHAGECFRLHLFWDAPDFTMRLKRVAVWVHFLRENDTQPVFQGDHVLLTDLRMPQDNDMLVPSFYEIPVPHDVPSGKYKIKVGLWFFQQRRSIYVQSADLPHDKSGIYLTDVTILNNEDSTK